MAIGKSMPGSKPTGRPPVAVELSPDGVLAAALPGSGQSLVYAYVPLPQGAVVPGIGEPNIHDAEAVSQAIRSALSQVAPRTRAVSLVLPDTAVRIFVLDFESLPPRVPDAISVLRFRLRKMVPFDVEHAGVSYQVLTQENNELRVLAAVIPGPSLSEYEAVVRAAGYEPGAILSTSLAALEVIDTAEAVLAVHLTPLALTTSITSGSDLLLHRTLELPEDPTFRLSEIQRGIAVAAAYFEDSLQAPARTLHYSGCYETADFARWIDAPALTVVDLAPRPETGAVTPLGTASIAGVAGALAGARQSIRITVNLATRAFADLAPALKRLRIGIGVLALIAIALLFSLRALHQKAEQVRAREHSLDGEIARVTRERQGYQALMQRPDNAQLLTQAGALNKLFDEKAFSWTLAMENLETVLPGGVLVSTLEPVRASDGHITLHLRVEGPRDRSVDLVRNLEHSHRFLDPRIVGENSAEVGSGPNQRLEPVSATNRFEFDLLAEYNPPSPDEARLATHSKKPAADDSENTPPNSSGNSGAGQRHIRPPYKGPVVKPIAQGGPQ